MTNPAHDSDNPASHLNALEAAWLAADGTIARCPHCTETRTMLPMSGTGWAVEVTHEQECPAHDDNIPTPVRPDETSEDW